MRYKQDRSAWPFFAVFIISTGIVVTLSILVTHFLFTLSLIIGAVGLYAILRYDIPRVYARFIERNSYRSTETRPEPRHPVKDARNRKSDWRRTLCIGRAFAIIGGIGLYFLLCYKCVRSIWDVVALHFAQ